MVTSVITITRVSLFHSVDGNYFGLRGVGPKLDESESGQVVVEKVKLSQFCQRVSVYQGMVGKGHLGHLLTSLSFSQLDDLLCEGSRECH